MSGAAGIAVRFDHVSVTYHDAVAPTLTDVDLAVEDGELVVVVGTTGSGKSTLLRATCGLVPHFSGGTLSGRVEVRGRDTATHPPRELADVVGFVGQDPAASFVCDTVEEELAYVMENLGMAPAAMRRRVEETLDLLGLVDLRAAPVGALSGGEQQRVAIAAVLTASPAVLVLDEPTSSLDPAGAEDVLGALARLVHDVGLTVVMAEHRLERVVHLADRVALIEGGRLRCGPPAEMMATSPVAPPVVELGRLAGWTPLPLSIRDARRAAGDLRAALADHPAPTPRPGGPTGAPAATAAVVETDRVVAAYDDAVVLDGVDLRVRPGEIVALMGRNGAGKSTLLHHLVGLRRPVRGTVRIDGADPARLDGADRVRRVGLVPQDPGSLLYGETVAEECALADREGGLAAGTTAAVVDELIGGLDPGAHPRALSEGQRLVLALAVVLGHRPAVVLLDEPTRGLDYPAKAHLSALLERLAASGVAVIAATHDVELAAALADRVVVLARGEVIADGPARDVVCHSAVFAPQVAKILAPEPWLTVAEVRDALASPPPPDREPAP